MLLQECVFSHVLRFEVLPTIMDPQAEYTAGTEAIGDLRSLLPYTIKSLSRSVSQPVVFPRKHLDRRLNKMNASRGYGGGGSGGTGNGGTGDGGTDGSGGGLRHEDDLDIIKQIIEKDETLHDTADQVRQGGMHFRSQSLSHIPGEFSSVSSLPTLHHTESMHLLHSNYFSAPDFSQLNSPPGLGTKHSAGDVSGGDLSYHQLTHESRSSSLGDCHTSLGSLTSQPAAQELGRNQQQLQQVSSFGMNDERRGSSFDSQAIPGAFNGNSAQSGPLALSHHGSGGGFEATSHVSTYDFARHRDSSHSLSYSESDGNQTPVGYDLARRESSISDSVSSGAGSISFQFPSLARNSAPLSFSNSSGSHDASHSHLEVGGISTSNLPLRDYLTSQAVGSLVSGADQFERSSGCKTISRVENPSLTAGNPEFTGVLSGSKGKPSTCVYLYVYRWWKSHSIAAPLDVLVP